MGEFASLVLYAKDVQKTAAFYRALGFDLVSEQHDGGPMHYAVEVGPVHFAVYAADVPGSAPARRAAGSSFPGFYVDSLDATAEALTGFGPLLGRHEQVPWGCRMVLADPDGRPVEVNQRGHCPEADAG